MQPLVSPSRILLFSIFSVLTTTTQAQPVPAFKFSSPTYRISEGEGQIYDLSQATSTTGSRVVISRTGSLEGPVLVDLILTDVTATNGVHYTTPLGTNSIVTNVLQFGNFEPSMQVVLRPIQDSVTNNTREVTLILANPRRPTNAPPDLLEPSLVFPTNATVQFLDDDEGFNIERAAFQITETGPELVVGVLLSIGGTNGVSVDYQTVDTNFVTRAGSRFATGDVDYTSVSGTLNFGPGETRQTFSIPITQDALVEFNEDLQIQLLNPLGELTLTNFVVVTNADLTIETNEITSTIPWANLGKVTNALVTILSLGREDAEQPAGAGSMNWNPATALNPMPGANHTVNAVVVQDDGKALIGGDFTAVNSIGMNRLARLTTNGTFDAAFEIGTGADGYIKTIALHRDGPQQGKILIGGGFTSFDNIQRFSIARLASHGALDRTFDPGTGANGPINSILIQPDGRVLAAGDFTRFNGFERTRIVRLNSDGSVDPAFDPGTGPDGTVWAMALQEDGRVLLGGDFFTVDGQVRFALARLQSDGALDSTFYPGFGADGTVYSLEYIAPPTFPVTDSGANSGLVSSTNQVDTGSIAGWVDLLYDFGTSTNATNRLTILQGLDPILETNLISTGRLQIAYGPNPSSFVQIVVNERNPAGDTNWSYTGSVVAEGKILAAGAFTYMNAEPRSGFAQLRANGSVDPAVRPPFGADNTVFDLARQPDGRILLAGAFRSVNKTRRLGLARLFPNGTVDTSFLDTAHNHFAGLIEPDSFITDIELLSDGNILIGGHFSRLGGGANRTATILRHNVALIQGGETPGPGNAHFELSHLSIDEHAPRALVPMQRTNGTLGTVKLTAVTADGTAEAGADYESVGGIFPVEWPDGFTTPNALNVPLLDDSLEEGTETFLAEFFDLFGELDIAGEIIPVQPALGFHQQTIVSLLDNDFRSGTLGFAQAQQFVSEGSSQALIEVSRSGGASGTVTVDYQALPASTNQATASSDFMSRRGTLTFSSGQTMRSFAVPILDDTEVEFDEQIDLILSNPRGGAELDQASSILTIIDNDFAPGRLNLVDATFATNENTTAATVLVSRTGGNVGVLAVDLSTGNETALAGEDYVPAQVRLTWTDGDSSVKRVPIPLLDDKLVEGDESFQVFLSNPSVAGALGTRTNASVTIEDDDAYGEIQFAQPLYWADENSASVPVLVTRSNGKSGTVTVNFTTRPGSANADADYASQSGTLTFAPGELSRIISIPLLDDTEAEGDEMFDLILLDPAFASLGQTTVATVTVIDNERSNVPAGSIDTTFSPSASADAPVRTLVLTPSASVLLGGDFTTMHGSTRWHLAQLLPNGSLDPNFQPIANGPVHALALQSDGKILAGGLFGQLDFVNRSRIARLNPDGSLDDSFNPGSGADNTVFALAEIRVDGQPRIVAGGNFTSFNGAPRRGIVRLLPDGSIDPSFHSTTATDGAVYTLVGQADGSLLIGGDFTTVNNLPRPGLARLNPDGTLDLSFAPDPAAFHSIRALASTPTGAILVGGLFRNSAPGSPRFVARLTESGGIDPSFAAEPNGAVTAIELQPDGKILVGGHFTQLNGIARPRIARLTAGGALDPTINFGLGPNRDVTAIALQPDRKIVVGGGFTLFNEIRRRSVVRLHGGAMSGTGRMEFSRAAYTVHEDESSAWIVVRRAGGNAGSVSVQIATDSTEAAPGVDYQETAGRLAFAEGEVFKIFALPILDDDEIEPVELVQLELSTPDGGAELGVQPTAQLAIISDDSLIQFTSTHYSVNENTVGSRASIFVQRSGATNGTVQVDYQAEQGTATAPDDFSLTTGRLKFGPGEVLKSFSIPIQDDELVEINETIQLTLSNATPPAQLATAQAVLTIVEDDLAPGLLQFSTNAFVVTEDAGTAEVLVIRTNGISGVVSVLLSLADITATRGADYEAPNSILTFADGELSKTVRVPVLNDAISEGDEAVQLSLSQPDGGARLGTPAQALFTILDDEGAIGFAANEYSVLEDANLVQALVTRSGNASLALTVDYQTVPGTALPGVDFEPQSATLAFAPGQRQAIVAVPILDDTAVEQEKTFQIELANVQGDAQLARDLTTVRIKDNDILPANLGFAQSTLEVLENTTNAVIHVLRSGDLTDVSSAGFTTVDGSALAGQDYGISNGIVTFGPGETKRTFLIPIIDDFTLEPDEELQVHLFNLEGAAPLVTNLTLRILDNESSVLFLTNAFTVQEGASNAIVTLTRTNGTAGELTVQYQTALALTNAATPGLDYIPDGGTVLFTNGQDQAQILIPILDDFLLETNEFVQLYLTNATGGALGALAAATVEITDNDTNAGGFLFEAEGPFLAWETDSLLAVTLTRVAGSTGDVSVDILLDPAATNDLCAGTSFAVRGLDLSPVLSTLSWTNGESGPKTAFLTVEDDDEPELPESIQLFLSNPTGGATVNNDNRSRTAILYSEDQPAGAADVQYGAQAGINVAPGANNSVRAIAVFTNGVHAGKAMIAGDFTAINAEVRHRIARVHADGSVDQTFDPGIGANRFVSSVAIQPDGATVIGGGFTSYNFSSRNRIARLLEDGTLDLSFDPGDGANDTVHSLLIQQDGAILMGGDFTLVHGTPRMRIARLLPDGSLDGSFDPALGADGTILTMAVSPDGTGEILAGGSFTIFNGASRPRVVRLLSDGSLDPTFDPGAGAGAAVHTVEWTSQNGILIGGEFAFIDGFDHPGIARLLPDGRLDTGFDPGTGFDGPVFALRTEADGGIVAGGQFSHFDGVPRTNLARLYPDGVLDTSFLDPYFNQLAPGMDAFVTTLASHNVTMSVLQTNLAVVNGTTNTVLVTNVVTGPRVLVGGGFARIGGGRHIADASTRLRVGQVMSGNSPAPGNFQFTQSTYSVSEETLNGVVILEVERLNGSLGGAELSYETINQSALAGIDFQTSSGTLTWTNCQSGLQQIIVPILDNQVITGNRTFEVRLFDPTGTGTNAQANPALGITRTARIQIVEDDVEPALLAFRKSEFAFNERGRSAIIDVARNGGLSGAVSVEYSTSAGTATGDLDYQNISGVLLFSSGQTNKTFTIPVLDDALIEPDESVHLQLSQPSGGALLSSPSNAVLRILDDDFAPGRLSFATADLQVAEDASLVELIVERTGGSRGLLQVDFATVSGSAEFPSDFADTRGTLQWHDADITTRRIQVPLANDRIVEGDESFQVQLTSPSNPDALGRSPLTTIHIRDDDAYGEFSFNASAYTANENAGSLRILVVRKQGSAHAVSVRVDTMPGTAAEARDYQPFSELLQFAPGETVQPVTLPIPNDSVADGDRQFLVRLSDPLLATLGRITLVPLTVLDDESSHRPPGSLDPTWQIGAGPNQPVESLLVDPDGRVLVGGSFTLLNQSARGRLARLLPDGRLDPVFNRTTSFQDTVLALAHQVDGRLLVGGTFNSVNQFPLRSVARLEADGMVDLTFQTGSGANGPVRALSMMPLVPGHILAGGEFTTFNQASQRGLILLHPDGALAAQPSFGSGVHGSIHVIHPLDNGQILVGGEFNQINGFSRRSIARLNPDGSLDGAFDPGLGPDGVIHVIAVQENGQIVIAGRFDSVSGVPRSGVAKLDSDGFLDASFDPGAGFNGPVLAGAFQLDGKLLLGGDFLKFNNVPVGRLVRLHPDGAIDPTINFGSGANGPVRAMALQSDQRIVVGGDFTEFNQQSQPYLARLYGGSMSGHGEISFAQGQVSVREDQPQIVIRLKRAGGTEGLVTVDYATRPGNATPGVDYMETVGTLQFQPGQAMAEFAVELQDDSDVEPVEEIHIILQNPRGGATLGIQPVSTIQIGSDDSIISFAESTFSVDESSPFRSITVLRTGDTNSMVSVSFSTAGGTATAGVDFLSTNGNLTFAPGERIRHFDVSIIDDPLVEADESIFLQLSSPSGTASLGLAASRLTIVNNDSAPGSFNFEPSFSVLENVSRVDIAVIRSNGSSRRVTVDYAIAGGTATAGEDYLDTTGTLVFADGDTTKRLSITLLDDSWVEGNELIQIALANPTGGASLGRNDIFLLVLEDDDLGPGTLDPSFNPGSGANDTVHDLILQTDGRILLGGAFDRLNGFNRPHIAQLLPDGQVDQTFQPGPGPDATVHAIDLLPDGRIIIGGQFQAVSSLPRSHVARLAATGSVDGTFRPALINGTVHTVGVSSGGKIYAGGSFTSPAGRIIRLNNDGTLDVSFDPTGGASDTVHQILPLPDASLIIGGNFTRVGGMVHGRLAQLSKNGLPEPAFQLDSIFNDAVLAVLKQPDDKILVAGRFSGLGSTSFSRIARLNPNGSLDSTFQPASPNADVISLALQPDGKILIGGEFTAMGTEPAPFISRLNFDGSLDASFNPGTGPNAPVHAIALEPDGRILIAGAFTAVNGVNRNRIARLRNEIQTSSIEPGLVLFDLADNTLHLSFQSAAGRIYLIEQSFDLVNWEQAELRQANGSVTTFTAPWNGNQPQQFFRVQLFQPE